MPEQPPLPDHLRPDLSIVFVGINPGLRSAALGHHYAGPSNRFWKLIYDANLVPEPLSYRDDGRLPEWGLGLTNLVSRSTASMESLTPQDYTAGRLVLMRKLLRYRPRVVALLGMTLYRILSLPFHAGGFSYADTVGQERPQESSLTYPIHAMRSAGIPSGTCCKICG